MPLKRKLITVGNSRAVVIPPDWLKYYEEKSGQTIEYILMEVNNIIKIAIQEPDDDKQVGSNSQSLGQD